MSGLDKRQAAWRAGKRAETWAAWYLRARGFRILERGRRGRRGTGVGEIDLIAARGALLVFVEVKARASLEEARAAITPHQQKRLGKAAERYLAQASARAGRQLAGRFDAVLVSPGPFGLPKIAHLPNAWTSAP